MTRQVLKALDAAEAKAYRAMMNGSEADARSVRHEEGKNYVAWSKASDACYAYRKANKLLGKRS